MMTRFCTGPLGVLLGALAAQTARASETEIRGIAREAATLTAIKVVCPAHIPTDTGFAETLQGVVLMDGIRKIGKEPFMRLVATEQADLRAAYGSAGHAAWCRRQQARLAPSYPDVFRP